MSGRELCIRRNHPELLLAGERPLAQGVPAVVELALVPVGPLGRHMVRRVGRAGSEVGEERLVRHQRLLLPEPRDRLVGHVLHEVVALFGRLLGLDRDGALVDGGVVLVRLAADEAVEVLEAAARRPVVERAHRARLPDRHLVALAELRGRVAVELERLGERGAGVGPDRVVARRAGGDLRDPAHPDRVVVSPAQQGRPRRRAERRRVKAVVLEPARRQPLGYRSADRAAEGARGAEADVVDQHDQDVGRPFRRPHRPDRRVRRSGIFGVIGGQSDRCDVGNGKNSTV